MNENQKNNTTLSQRLSRAKQLKGEGYNCSQCLFMAFRDLHGINDEIAAKLSCGLGGGVAGMRQVCGVVSTMASLLGIVRYASPSDKKALYDAARECANEFEKLNGSIICGILKSDQPLRKPCMSYIEDGIKILQNKLGEEN